MKHTLNRLDNAYLSDILEQPEALRRCLSGLKADRDLLSFAEKLNRGDYKRVVLTGMGSSYFALHPLQLRLLEKRITSLMVETSELIHYMPEMLEADSLLIVVSQSGRSAEIVRLLEKAPGNLQVIAVTNDKMSPLALRASATVMINAGLESSVSCKTYVCSLQALEWLGAVLLGANLESTTLELSEAAPAVERYLLRWESHTEELLGWLTKIEQLFITGRGASLAAAGTGGLILKESARFPAEGMSSAAFRHGPFELVNSHVLVTVLEGDPRTYDINRRLVSDIRAAGGSAMLIASDDQESALSLPRVPSALLPMLEILPIQMISLALAARNGHEAGRFELASKITTTE